MLLEEAGLAQEKKKSTSLRLNLVKNYIEKNKLRR